MYLALGAVRYAGRDREQWRMVRRIHRILSRMLVGVGGLEASYQQPNRVQASHVSGDFVELGVARGGGWFIKT